MKTQYQIAADLLALAKQLQPSITDNGSKVQIKTTSSTLQLNKLRSAPIQNINYRFR